LPNMSGYESLYVHAVPLECLDKRQLEWADGME